jgi:hypothetical protein
VASGLATQQTPYLVRPDSGIKKSEIGERESVGGSIASRGKFAFEPRLFPIAATDQPKTTRLCHGASEPAASNAAHRRQQNRMRDAEFFGEAGA